MEQIDPAAMAVKRPDAQRPAPASSYAAHTPAADRYPQLPHRLRIQIVVGAIRLIHTLPDKHAASPAPFVNGHARPQRASLAWLGLFRLHGARLRTFDVHQPIEGILLQDTWLKNEGGSGPIPANTGEPGCNSRPVKRRRGYPHVCGGTVGMAGLVGRAAGLFPPVQGNFWQAACRTKN